MGREIKRVPLDFDHPIDVLWPGYCQPNPRRKCATCEGNGMSPEGLFLDLIAQLLVIAATERGNAPRHPYTHDVTRPSLRPIGQMTRMHELTEAIAGRPMLGIFGHDASDQWNISRALIAAAGLHENWTSCVACGGSGENPEDAHIPDPESYDPPAGDAYQLWTTTNEGAPISPPFATPEELADWLVTNNASSFGYDTASYGAWLKFIKEDAWAPSMVIDNGKLMSGVEYVAESK